MRLSLLLFTLCPVVLGNTMENMDVDGLCYIYSNSTCGCTGSSEPIALLDGAFCSNLSTVDQHKRTETRAVNVTVCGPHRQAGQDLAWITADKSGLLTFQNIGGDTASCTAGKEFKVGAFCSALSGNLIKTPTETPASTSSAKVIGTSTVASNTNTVPPKPSSMDC
ncbi:hypothetical protein N7451_012391 [Penicillium sp. IBT 35674x]|nr:hypothetical protein N7451_012391 [Penicillium sp. IBT 35674x]